MAIKIGLLGAVFGVAFGWAASAQASVTYVGSWIVQQGPTINDNPIAYSGQEAAATIFGGVGSDYLMSTIDRLVENINGLSWVSEYGTGQALQVAQDYVNSIDGTYSNMGDTSAYVNDSVIGDDYTNYAFRITADPTDVPEPASLALLGLGLLGAGLVRRVPSAG